MGIPFDMRLSAVLLGAITTANPARLKLTESLNKKVPEETKKSTVFANNSDKYDSGSYEASYYEGYDVSYDDSYDRGSQTKKITTEMTTETTTEMTTEITTEMTTETTTEMTTEIPTEMTTETTTEMTTEMNTGMTTEMTTQMTTQMTTAATTAATIEMTSEMKSETTSAMTTEMTTAATMEMTTEMKSETTSEMTTPLFLTIEAICESQWESFVRSGNYSATGVFHDRLIYTKQKVDPNNKWWIMYLDSLTNKWVFTYQDWQAKEGLSFRGSIIEALDESKPGFITTDAIDLEFKCYYIIPENVEKLNEMKNLMRDLGFTSFSDMKSLSDPTSLYHLLYTYMKNTDMPTEMTTEIYLTTTPGS